MKDLIRSALKDSQLGVLALDPGETTGYAFFRGADLQECGQLATGLMENGFAVQPVKELLDKLQSPARNECPLIDQVVIEDYRVYSWKAKEHSFEALHTPQLIGALKYLCSEYKLPVRMQMAQQAKGFCTDDKLKAWGLWQPGKKHARDAIRHAVYYLLFEEAKVHQDRKAVW